MTVPILQLDNISKSFGGLLVVDNLSFDVQPGQRLALIGPNGAGKTTVFNLLSGVYPIDRGRILLDGEDITTLRSNLRIGKGLSRSFQNIRLMPHLTALENVMLGQHIRANRIKDFLYPIKFMRRGRWAEEARAALAEAGLDHIADGRVRALPYGMQKRIELVRAAIANPRVLLLDEPAAGLNATETRDIQRLLEGFSARGMTLLVVEHDMHFVADFCDHVVVLNFGKKIVEGSLDEVRANAEVRQAYLGQENGESECHAA